ncbi:hypothetical protein BZG36_03819 [Bifiguratus adelaidae]|uniref:DNA-directed RNA polymerases I and III subunit RPAC2 n=1 Tax=Bifiguratus adelaidae TaxID=1938954 RepID=A0A261XZQ0_9FUNG|nr:hypothetical protein BZG36_03819 [Bifiguratus adelaidae]
MFARTVEWQGVLDAEQYMEDVVRATQELLSDAEASLFAKGLWDKVLKASVKQDSMGPASSLINHVAFKALDDASPSQDLTLLHIAARDGTSLDVMEALIAQGAITTIRDTNGNTPYDLAVRRLGGQASLTAENSAETKHVSNPDGDRILNVLKPRPERSLTESELVQLQERLEEVIKKETLIAGPDGDQTAMTFVLKDEDHTIGNALRYMIMKNPKVDYCGYSIPHPSEAKLHIRIQTIPGTTAYEALEKGLSDLIDLCGVVNEKFKENLEASQFLYREDGDWDAAEREANGEMDQDR